MKLIQRLMGRRQFLAAAGAGSASALALGKLGGMWDPAFRAQVAMAAQSAGASGTKGADNRYPNLLSPIKIGNKLLKNRIFYPVSQPHMLNGPENFPNEIMRSYYANVAKTAAVVTVRLDTGNTPRSQRGNDSAHMIIFDLEDYGVQNYICQMIEAIHSMGALAITDMDIGYVSAGGGQSMTIAQAREAKTQQSTQTQGGSAAGGQGGMPGGMGGMPGGEGGMPGGEGGMPSGGQGGMPSGGEGGMPGGGEGGMPGGGQGGMPGGGEGGGMPGGQQGAAGGQGGMPGGMGGMPGGMGGMPGGMGGQSATTEPVNVEDIITAAKEAVDQGLDMVHIPAVRNLTDTVAIENAVKTIEAVKNNTSLLAMMNCPGSGPGGSSANPQETAVELAKKFEGLVDLWRAGGNPSTGFDQEEGDPSCLQITEAIKKAGVKTITMAGGGFIFPDKNEEYIATGKCDMIALARPILSDFDYGKKLYEGRGEDIAPCVLCQKCHGISQKKDWYSVCSVNPILGNDVATRVIDDPTFSKKVAIIGGGPAGMRAAITAVERGHKVTLYEKESQLGGLLRRYSNASPYKWPYRAYKDYLVRQVNKLGIDIKLNTEATPSMIKKAGYDVVMVAIGNEAVMPKLQGVTEKNVYNVVDIFGKDKELGKSVVFIGGGEYGTESALYLGKAGINVTCITSEKELVVNDRPHGPGAVISAYRSMKNFTGITQAVVKSISKGKVTYTDSTGAEKTVEADSVVIFGGLKGKQDEALKFNNTAKKGVYPIGDCTGRCGSIQKATRNAFYAASQV